MRKTRLILAAVAAVATGTLLTACSGAPSGSAAAQGAGSGSTGPAAGKTVAYFAPSLGISYWQWVGYGVKQQAHQLHMKYVSYNANNDQSQQLANMRTAITAGVNAIVIGPVSSTSVPPLLQLAQQKHIPVAFAGIGAPAGVKNFTSAVTANNQATGVAEGKFICRAAKRLGGNQVGMLSLPQDRENAQKYLAGAKQAFAADGCDLVQVVQTKGLTVGEAVSETKDLLTAHPGIKGIYGMYDEAGTGASQVLASQGLTGKVALATADGSPTTVALVRKHKLDALFLQGAVGQGIVATDQVAKAIQGKPTTQAIPLDEPMVTPANIDNPKIQAQLKRVYPPSAGAY
jgi:ribose transport system substrate-binding protein